jgi:hypothetical protein
MKRFLRASWKVAFWIWVFFFGSATVGLNEDLRCLYVLGVLLLLLPVFSFVAKMIEE